MSDMKQYAQHLSNKGRYGDSELVHVTPDELSLLKNIGAGTINPDTGLYEFYHTSGHAGNEVTFDQKFADERDKQGAGGTFEFEGSSYSTNYAEEASSSVPSQNQGRGVLTEAERNVNRENSILGLDRDGDGSMWTSTDELGMTTNWLGQEMNIVAGVNDGYFSGSLDVDGDGSMWTSTTFSNQGSSPASKEGSTKQNNSTWGERFNDNLFGRNASPLGGIVNVVGLLAAPLPTLALAGLRSTIDTNNDGSMLDNITSSLGQPLTPEQQKRHDEFVRNLNNNDDDDRNTYSEVQEVVQEATAETAETDLSKLKFTINGDGDLPFLDYNYTEDGESISTSYDGSHKPFRLNWGDSFQSDAYVKSEQARNSLMQMIATLPRNLQDELKGDISVRMDSNNNINLYVGDQNDGYVEATYAGDKEGYKEMIGALSQIVEYTNQTSDTNFNSGYLARLNSFRAYEDYDTGLLQTELTNLRRELSMAEIEALRPAIQRKIAKVETELRRRNGEALTMADSINGLSSGMVDAVASVLNG